MLKHDFWRLIRYVFIVTCIALPFECYYQYHQNVMEINYYQYYVKPPFNCGPRGKTIAELGYSEWFGYALFKNQADLDCMFYLKQVSKSPWPNLFDLFRDTFVRVGEMPMLVLISGLSNGFNLHSKTMITTFFVSLVLIGLGYAWFNKKQQQQQQQQQSQPQSPQVKPPAYQQPYNADRIYREMIEIFKQVGAEEGEIILPNCQVQEQERLRISQIQKECQTIMDSTPQPYEYTNHLLYQTMIED